MEGVLVRRLILGLIITGALAVVGLRSSAAAAVTSSVTQSEEHSVPLTLRSFIDVIRFIIHYTSSSFKQQYSRIRGGDLSSLAMVCLTLCSLAPGLWMLRSRRKASNNDLDGSMRTWRELKGNRGSPGSVGSGGSVSGNDRETNDPGLFRKNSTYRSYTTSVATYPCIRTFFRPHPQIDKLPAKPSPLPLLVFIHGLGGSLAQFHPLLTSLVNISGCLGIDLPGCGLSDFAPSSWKAYTTEALVELLAVVIEDHLDKSCNQGVVLLSHSMGCSLSALLASSIPRSTVKIAPDVVGLVAICPRADPPSKEQVASYRMLLSIPSTVLDLWRRWDRRGGPESQSVARFVGSMADEELKKLQHKFNEQSKTPVWRRMAWGALPVHNEESAGKGGLPGRDVWSGLGIPVLLIAGESDTVTTPNEVRKIASYLGKTIIDGARNTTGESEALPMSAGEGSVTPLEHIAHGLSNGVIAVQEHADTDVNGLYRRSVQAQPRSPPEKRRYVQTNILPAPASHALLYDPATYRTLAGLIQTFLSEHVDQCLSLGWQLQLLTTEGKWDVKNLVKWQAVTPVSEPIAGTFRAMKTLREVDGIHSPAIFVQDWKDKIKAVIDISHESPVYDPRGLELGGIEYHKFPTVSKIPPTIDEVRDFIKLVDRLWLSNPSSEDDEQQRLIGVHCHYGFNRTGFFICSYLHERKGYGVQDAIDEFQKQRPPGIRHEHFIDTLFARYCVAIKRVPTF